MTSFKLRSWSPYLVGALIGILSWFTFASVDKPLGITTAFEYSGALALKAVAPDIVETNSYFKEPEKKPKIDWEWMLVLGVFVGAYISSKLSGDRGGGFESVPSLWRRRFGPSASKRFLGAFLGGALIMFGARLAQGCTSGHGISGALQLAVSSWIFVPVFVVTAAAAAFALYGSSEKGAGHV